VNGRKPGTASTQPPVAAPGLEVRLLGPLEVSVNGRPVTLTARRLRTLLAVLAMSAGKSVSVDRLAAAVWEADPPDNARRTVQTYVTRLRSTLGAESIITEPSGYVLQAGADHVDALRFLRLLDAAAEASDTWAERASLTEALALWRGTPFEGVRSGWLEESESTRLVERYLAAVERRTDLDIVEGRHGDLVAELCELTARHPLRESLWARLLTVLDRCGRQAEALERYETIRSRISDELGVDPGAELRGIHSDLLAGRRPDPTNEGSPVFAGQMPRPPAPPAPTRPFVGRESELARLQAAASGGAGLLVIDGEPGVGKTRLVEQFAATATVPVLFGRCPGYEAAPPLWAWEQVLRQLTACRPDLDQPAEVRSLLAHHWAEIESDATGARMRLYEAVTGILRAATPLIVALDDLHWSDTASLRLLTHVASAAVPHLLVIGTFRPHEADGLTETLALLARAGSWRIHLDGLGNSEVRALVAAITGEDPGPGRAGRLTARTGGNPFFVQHLARLPEGALPQQLRDVVLRRVATLPEPAAALLRTAAVAGLEFDGAVVAEVSGRDLEEALEDLDAGLAAGLLTEGPGRLGCFGFSHALIRDALEGEFSRLRRARLHRRLGEVTGARYGSRPEWAAEVARHWLAAAELDAITAAMAVEQAARAARAALARLAPEDATRLWRQALAAAELAGTERADRFELLVGLSEAQLAAAQFRDALETMEEALGAAEDDPKRVVRVASSTLAGPKWEPFSYGWAPPALLAALGRAVERLAPGEADRVLGLGCLAVLQHARGEVEEAATLSREALAGARSRGDPQLLARLLHLRLVALDSADHLLESWEPATELASLGAGGEHTLFAQLTLVAVLVMRGELAEAWALLEAVQPQIDALRSLRFAVQAGFCRAGLLAFTGRLEESVELVAGLGAQLHPSQNSFLELILLVNRFDVHLQEGRLQALTDGLRAAAERTGIPIYRTLLAYAEARCGDAGRARDTLRRDSPPPRDYTWLGRAVLRLDTAVLLEDRGETARLRALLLPFGRRLAVGRDIIVLGAVAGHLGEAALLLGEHDRAREELCEALELLERCGSPYWARRAREALARCGSGSGSQCAEREGGLPFRGQEPRPTGAGEAPHGTLSL
jgi:DNA-binding SARP family transcriptional activator